MQWCKTVLISGSILNLYDEWGDVHYSSTYDAWGVQTITRIMF